jgi:hypothetical protein
MMHPMHPLAHLRQSAEDDPDDVNVEFLDVGRGTVSVEEVWEWSHVWEQSLLEVYGLYPTRERERDGGVEFDIGRHRLLDASGGTELEVLVYAIVRERVLSEHLFIPGPHHILGPGIGGVYSVPSLASIISVYARVCGYQGATSTFADICATGGRLFFIVTPPS